MSLALTMLIAYLLGSIPFGYLAGWVRGIDLRRQGSGNTGATNALRLLGARWALPVAVLDVGKGFLAAWLGATQVAPADPWAPVLVGLAAVAGHNWSMFLKFGGGRGVATTGGIFLYLLPMHVLIGLAIAVAVIALTRYVSLGSMVAASSLALIIGLSDLPLPYRLAAVVGALVIIWRHRPNIGRLLRGQENRLGQRAKATGEKGKI